MKANNKTKTLQTDSNADIIFKQGDYVHTYVVFDISGYPNGSILYLLDSDMNQLYSPYDVNANQIKTECKIITGETDALQLPANYNGDEYTDFEEGTYNWKLKFNGNQNFEEQIIPITIKIQDFDLETNLTQIIYPGEDIKIKLRTYINTPPSNDVFDVDRLTTNASYDNETGIISYPVSDLNTSVGNHNQIINVAKNYSINYTIKTPVSLNYSHSPIHYLQIKDIRGIVQNITASKLGSFTFNFYVDGVDKGRSYLGITNQYYFRLGDDRASANNPKTFPPGTHEIYLKVTNNNDSSIFYISETDTFTITTEDCSLTLSRGESNIVATYMYNNETPIPNASIQILEDDIVIDTLITDSNGQCIFTGQYNSTYKAQAIDYDNSILLESNTLTMEFITINITNMPSEYEWFVITFNGVPDDMIIINFSQSYMNYTLYPMNVDRLTLENNILSINIDKYLWKKYRILYNTRGASISKEWPAKYLYNLEDNDNDDIITIAFEDLPNQPNEG